MKLKKMSDNSGRGYERIAATVLLACGIFLFLAVSCSGGGTAGRNKDNAVSGSDTSGARIVFDAYEHDFGKVEEGEKVAFSFRFVNQGTADLVIKSAGATCGCTVPRYDKKPVSPGGNGSVEVVFNTSGREGIQTKTIVISSNGTVPETMLRIRAEVIPGKQ